MLKRCNISCQMDYEKEAYLCLLFHYTEKRIFKRAQQKSNVRARPDVTFWAVGYHSPRVPASFSHVLCKT